MADKVWIVKGKRGRFLLRFKDEKGVTRQRTTPLLATNENYKSALVLAAELTLEIEGVTPPKLLIKQRTNDSKFEFNVNVDDSERLDGHWTSFRTYFETTHLSGLSKSYRETMLPILGRFETFANPVFVQDINSATLRRWFASLRNEGLAESSIRTYWRHLSVFLSIAVDDGFLRSLPKVRLPKRESGSLAKGRAITTEEFERMRAAIAKERPNQIEQWEFFLDGLWLSGLRIGEAYRLTWQPSGFYVDMTKDRPEFVILKQKNKKRQSLPMVPDFAQHLQTVPESLRRGFVFKLKPARGVGRISDQTAERTIAKFGERAAIRVSDRKKKNGKYKTATAHDLRRSFASRWSRKVTPQTLQSLMRHSSYATTQQYYENIRTDEFADEIYNASTNEIGEKRV